MSYETNVSTDRKSHTQIRIQPSKSGSLHLSFITKLGNLKARKFPELQWDAETLISLWQQFSNIVRNSAEECVREYAETLCEKTKEFTMHKDWTKVVPLVRNHLVVLRNNLNMIWKNAPFSDNFKNIIAGMIGIAVEPWKHPLVLNLMKTDCSLDDVASYFDIERSGKITIDRLRLLLSRVKQPSDYIFVTNFVGNVLTACEKFKQIEYALTTDELNYIVDAYLVGLFNLSKTEHLSALIKRMPFEDCYNLHKRYIENGIGFSNRDTEKTFWQYTERVINMVNRNLLLRILGLDLSKRENLEHLDYVLSIYIEREDLTCEEYQRSILCALTCYGKSSNVRLFDKLFIKKVKNRENLKPFCAMLFIKELITTINELEHYKTTLNDELANISRHHLSDSYLFVCEYFHNDVEICKEAILNAFNTNPTESNYQKVVTMASIVKVEQLSENRNGCPIANSNREPYGYFNRKSSGNLSMEPKDESSKDLDSNEEPNGYSYKTCNGYLNGELVADSNGERKRNSFKSFNGYLNGKLDVDTNGEPRTKYNGYSDVQLDTILNGEPCADSSGKYSVHLHGELGGGDLNRKPGRESNGRYRANLNIFSYASLLPDLFSVLKYNRHSSLSWSMDWNTLEKNCVAYMKNFDARNVEKELIYLRLDFDSLKQNVVDSKDWFVDIEEGYEQYFTAPQYKK